MGLYFWISFWLTFLYIRNINLQNTKKHIVDLIIQSNMKLTQSFCTFALCFREPFLLITSTSQVEDIRRIRLYSVLILSFGAIH